MAQHRTLTDDDIQAIRDAFNEDHPCSTFTDEEIVSIKAMLHLFTPENVQAAAELLAGFKDTKKSIWKGIKAFCIIMLLFAAWAAWHSGFIPAKIGVK